MALIDELANEVLQDILDYLPHQDLCQAALVSRRWSHFASNSLWLQVDFRIHPQNNLLLQELRRNPLAITRFCRTIELSLNLSIVDLNGELPSQPDLDECVGNFEIFKRVCTYLPPKMRGISIQLEPFPCEEYSLHQIQTGFPAMLAAFKQREIHEVHIDYRHAGPMEYRYAHNSDVFLFKDCLNSLAVRVESMMKGPPPMPHLRKLVLSDFGQCGMPFEEGFHLQKWADLRHLPLQTFEVNNKRLPDAMQLPHTITNLTIAGFWGHAAALRLGFYHLPNLQHLTIGYLHSTARENIMDSHRRQGSLPIVSTELKTLCIQKCPFYPQFFGQVALSCLKLDIVTFSLSATDSFCNHFLHSNLEQRSYAEVSGKKGTFWEQYFYGLAGRSDLMVCFNGENRTGVVDFESLSWSAVRVSGQGDYWPSRSDSVAKIRAMAEFYAILPYLTMDPLSTDQIDKLQGVAHLPNCWRLIPEYEIPEYEFD
jgi:hypothetical protein